MLSPPDLSLKTLLNIVLKPDQFEVPGLTRDMIPACLDDFMKRLRLETSWSECEEKQALLNEMQGKITGSALYDIDESTKDRMVEICGQLCSFGYISKLKSEVFVGFDEEVATLLDQLTGTSSKQLQIFSIVGMAGIGKTTVARKLYTDPLIEYWFDIRAWTYVSQVYLKRDLLVYILKSFVSDLTDEFNDLSEEHLGEKLYRLLKGRRYFVVLDDIWDCRAWNDLKIYFPDDKTGSRVIFTSRDVDVSLHVGAARSAHVLRLRTEDESWDIFQKKVFRTGICPRELEDHGKVIARKCKGLPLAIIIIAGLLKNNLSFTWWEKIAASLHSFMVSDPSQYMDALALSYDHLPSNLRPCFLFLGAFPEDYEIPVKKLIWLWVAQGFIHETGNRILEDVAEEFLMDLINRSLLMSSSIRADGRVKTCHIHDLLRELSLRKAEEEICLPNMYRYDKVSSMLCSPMDLGRVFQNGGSILSDTYEFLRVLDVESIRISLFPLDAVQLLNLRYLAIQALDGSPQASLSNLLNLQTLLISSRKNIVIPKSIWDMVHLRHLCIRSGENLIEEPIFVQVERDGCPKELASLQTLSQVSPRSCQDVFSRIPNLKKLGFCGPLISSLGDLDFPDISSLRNLEKLKLLNSTPYFWPTRSCNPILLPEKLKILTLSNTGMDWEEMWTFSLLPHLEVLKLKFHACIGERWETGDAKFERLKVLKLHDLDLGHWVSSNHNFPTLQRLVVRRCLKLDSIPLDLGKILTVEVIEVSGCSTSAHSSALEIQKEQESEGNFFLKVHAKPELEIQIER